MSRSQGKAFLQLVVTDQKPACANEEPELFFPNYGAGGEFAEALAKRVCAKCPITAQCLEFAFHTNDKHAILGGYTPAERESMRRNNSQRRAA